MSEQAFPLTWPRGWPRCKSREARAPFSVGKEREVKDWRWGENNQRVEFTKKVQKSERVTVAIAVDRVDEQLSRLGAVNPVLSTNLETRLNGLPRGGQRNPDDPGAAVYFTFKGKRTVFACDKWADVADNIAAIAAHIRAIRSIENFGVGSLEQAFRGYQQLEDFTQGVPWRRVLGFKDEQAVTLEMAEARFRELAKRHHSDVAGGDDLQMAQLNVAIGDARKELKRTA